jgi:uncharacterized cupredoxin-like copper-binding protein
MSQLRSRMLLAVLFGASCSIPVERTSADPGHYHEGDQAHSPAGHPGDRSTVSKTVLIKMLDTMRFEPAAIHARQGQTVRFVVTNAGKLRHEFGIGTPDEQKVHAEMMLADPAMRHNDGRVIIVEPGKTKELIWRFDKAGTYEAACQEPGHYPAGMMSHITVTR